MPTASLYWADVRGPALHCMDPAANAFRRWPIAEPLGAFALTASGQVVAALPSGIYRIDLASGEAAIIDRPEHDRPHNRPNDGKVSPCGNFFVFGSMDDRPLRAATGALYALDFTGRCRRIADGFRVSNGLAWSDCARKAVRG